MISKQNEKRASRNFSLRGTPILNLEGGSMYDTNIK
jgi:hypothetical protein